MIREVSFVFGLALSLQSVATEALPSDVRHFIDRREGCDHMRGEEPGPGDKQRARELKREMDRLCKGTDRQLAQLKKKYAANVGIMKRLDEFEPQVEAVQPAKKRSH